MPISPDKKALYPKNWQEIRERILARAENKCEKCGLRNHSVGYRDENGHFQRNAGSGPCDASGEGLTWPGYEPLSHREAKEFADYYNSISGGCDDEGNHWIVIVLTIAHINPDPADCRDENLKALCQACHNRMDAPMRANNAKTTRKNRMAVGSLFQEVTA